ncbi:hypothetical protein ACFXDO_25245 [Streptomyces nigra]|uniref:hypothetical protein n=1 Tax=Streptomyces nigra TaxID=1827580 RepID=UPI0036C41403
MVTVIPVIMVVATVEFLALIQRKAAEPPPAQDMDSPLAWITVLRELLILAFYATLIVSHCHAEILLIDWLASNDRPPSPEMARRIATTGISGFIAVTALTGGLMVWKSLRPTWAIFRALRQSDVPGWSQPPPQRPRIPHQRSRPRPINPAHRAVRGSRRPLPSTRR